MPSSIGQTYAEFKKILANATTLTDTIVVSSITPTAVPLTDTISLSDDLSINPLQIDKSVKRLTSVDEIVPMILDAENIAPTLLSGKDAKPTMLQVVRP